MFFQYNNAFVPLHEIKVQTTLLSVETEYTFVLIMGYSQKYSITLWVSTCFEYKCLEFIIHRIYHNSLHHTIEN